MGLDVLESNAADIYARLRKAARDNGRFERFDRGYSAFLKEDGPALLVSFELVDDLIDARKDRLPFATSLVEEAGFSQLTILSERESWFRDPIVYAFFDRLIDNGFFDGFDRVVFYGKGMCGYAAAAFSVAAPGATVVALNPQATLDPSVTGWDPRFRDQRRLCFTDRYGYAPDMLDAADHVYLLFDPHQDLDAIHASLFTRPNVTKLRCQLLGETLERDLFDMGVLAELADAACEGQLSPLVFHRLFRARRRYPRYVKALLRHTEQAERPFLSAVLCHGAVGLIDKPKFRRRLAELETDLMAMGKTVPWRDRPAPVDPGPASG